MSFEFVTKLPTPTEIKEQYPVPEEIKTLKAERDAERLGGGAAGTGAVSLSPFLPPFLRQRRLSGRHRR